jgi:hypothetical protein
MNRVLCGCSLSGLVSAALLLSGMPVSRRTCRKLRRARLVNLRCGRQLTWAGSFATPNGRLLPLAVCRTSPLAPLNCASTLTRVRLSSLAAHTRSRAAPGTISGPPTPCQSPSAASESATATLSAC